MPKFRVHYTTAGVIIVDAYDSLEAEDVARNTLMGENLFEVTAVDEVQEEDDARPAPRPE